MTTLPSNPLAALIAKARETLPAQTGATQAATQARLRPHRSVVLADISGSMAEAAGRGRRKIDVLEEALRPVRGSASIIAFASTCTEIAPGDPLPQPDGGTALHLALQAAARLGPTHLLVISDGHPDDPAAAIKAADRLSARIDVIYCGPERDREGIAFLRRLARAGGGVRHADLARDPAALPRAVSALLEPPR